MNEAVEQAHTQGVLTAASLMVGAPGMAEAVTVARRQPNLAVGLHVVLTDGVPVLPAARIPSLTQKNGRFRNDMAGLGLLLALSREARAEMLAEIRAQLDRFAETGLTADHVNAHKHFHLHPLIGAALIQVAAGAGITAWRLPAEAGGGRIQNAWCGVMRRRGTPWGLAAPDRVVGLRWSGAFTAERVLEALGRTPPGVTEFYFHPATSDEVPGGAPGYRYTDEFSALTDPRVIAAIQDIPRGGYAAMLAPGRGRVAVAGA